MPSWPTYTRRPSTAQAIQVKDVNLAAADSPVCRCLSSFEPHCHTTYEGAVPVKQEDWIVYEHGITRVMDAAFFAARFEIEPPQFASSIDRYEGGGGASPDEITGLAPFLPPAEPTGRRRK